MDASNLAGWLSHLRQLFPPEHIALVGAGNGTSELVGWLMSECIETATLVEADLRNMHGLRRHVASFSGWTLRSDLIAPVDGHATFHVASLGSESGLVPAETLRAYWPNIVTRHTEARETIGISAFLADLEPRANWLLLDCMLGWEFDGAGLADVPDHLDVLLARSILDTDMPTTAARASALRDRLQEQGMRLVAQFPGRNPALGHMLFTRDVRSALERLRQLEHEKEAAQAQLLQANEAWRSLHDQFEALGERHGQCGSWATRAASLEMELASEVARRQSLESENARLREALDQQTATAAALTDMATHLHRRDADLLSRMDDLARLQREGAQRVDTVSSAIALWQGDRSEAEARSALHDALEQQASELRAIRSLSADQAQSLRQLDGLSQEIATLRAVTNVSPPIAQVLSALEQQAVELKTLHALAQNQVTSVQKVDAFARDMASWLAGDPLSQVATQLHEALRPLDPALQLLPSVAQQQTDGLRRLDAIARELATLRPDPSVQALAKEASDGVRTLASDLVRIEHLTREGLQGLGDELRNLDKLRSQREDALSETVEASTQTLVKDTLTKVAESRDAVRSHVTRALLNAVKQLEAFSSLKSYLEGGRILPAFHEWPISADLGVFLIEHIRDNRPDCVVEFGSGTSTLLFATAGQGRATAAAASPRPGLPFVTAFEHDLRYLEKTRRLLRNNDLERAANLVHAPLADWSATEQGQLFYRCEAELARLQDMLGKGPARILVLVDGPPGSSCKHARYPALPAIMDKFPNHCIDFVLDDANRAEEVAIVEKWREYLKKHQVQFTETKHVTEKGLYVITVNPTLRTDGNGSSGTSAA